MIKAYPTTGPHLAELDALRREIRSARRGVENLIIMGSHSHSMVDPDWIAARLKDGAARIEAAEARRRQIYRERRKGEVQ